MLLFPVVFSHVASVAMARFPVDFRPYVATSIQSIEGRYKLIMELILDIRVINHKLRALGLKLTTIQII